MLTLAEASKMAIALQQYLEAQRDIVWAGEVESLRLRGFFAPRITDAQRREYADHLLGSDRRAGMKMSIAPPLAGMARVYLAWLLRAASSETGGEERAEG